MTTDNVVPFPKRKRENTDHPPFPMKIGEQSSEADQIRDDLLGIILLELAARGIDISVIEQTHLNDLALILEAVNSLVFRDRGMHHPLQYVANTVFSKSATGLALNPHMSYVGIDSSPPPH